MNTGSTANSFIPLMMNIKNRRVLVVGGGNAALMKVRNLVTSGGRVIVISPSIINGIDFLVQSGSIRWWQDRFSEKHLAGATLVVAATDDELVNKSVVSACRKRGILVVGSGKRNRSRLSFCASVSRGLLSIGLSTCGTAPSLSKHLKKKIEDMFPLEWALVADAMASLRRKMQQSDISVAHKKIIWTKVLEGSSIDYLLAGKMKEYKAEVRRCFSSLQE